MCPQRITVNSLRFDFSIRRSWECYLAARQGDLIVLDGLFERQIIHDELGTIRRGTVSREYYWLDRWYNIFIFWEPEGALRNWYCNIGMPPSFRDGQLEYVDLDIDVLVYPDRTYRILDLDEFSRNAELFSLPVQIAERAHESLEELIQLIGGRGFPFAKDQFPAPSNVLDTQNVAANDDAAAGL